MNAQSAALEHLSAHALAARFATGALSPVEVTAHALATIERANPHINALYYVDAESALAAARRSEERWRRGTPRSPLDGVPTVIKDGLDAIGWPNYRGSAANRSPAPVGVSDAPAVARQREGGMVLLGKSTMCDYGMLASGISSRHGTTRNPWNLSANCSGSSSGTAAAVAAGIATLAVGTDIVGSVRHPASFCGLFGLKPSQGRVPYMPPGAPTVVAGPMARNLEDLCQLLSVIAQPDARDFSALPAESTRYASVPAAELRRLRIGIIEDMGFGLPPEPCVRDALDSWAEQCRMAGATIERLTAPFTPDAHRPIERFYQARAAVELASLPPAERARSPIISAWSAEAAARTAVQLASDIAAMAAIRGRMVGAIDGFDALLLPTVPVAPYAADAPGHDPDNFFLSWSNTFVFNLTEQPALTMPVAWTDDQRPIGIQLVGPRFGDARVIAIARALERLLPAPTWPTPGADVTGAAA